LEYLKDREPRVVFAALNKYSPSIRDLSVSRWVKLPTNIIEELLRSTPELRALNVSFCQKLDFRRLLCVIVPQYCPKLTSLDISYIDPTGHKRITAVLRDFLSLECGRRLESLFLNGNALTDLRRLCSNSAANGATENITVLHMSRVSVSSQSQSKILLVDFVKAFPNLRVLHLCDALVDFTCAKEEDLDTLQDVWPDLYECNISASPGWRRYDDGYDLFIRLLGRCMNLRRLDMSGLRIRDRLGWLRQTPLTYLNLSRVRDLAEDNVSIDFFSTWSRSLETLSIAWMIGYVEPLCQLFITAKDLGMSPRVKYLDLTGTCVTPPQLKILLDICQALETVDLQSCRGMPLGMKKIYQGTNELVALRQKLENENYQYTNAE